MLSAVAARTVGAMRVVAEVATARASIPEPRIIPYEGPLEPLKSYQWAVANWPEGDVQADDMAPVSHGAPRVEFVVVHATEGDSTASARSWLDQPEQTGSYHYTIDRRLDATGSSGIWRHVPTNRIAYHAGRSGWPLPAKVGGSYAWAPRQSLNGRSWGFAFANRSRPGHPLTEFQDAAGLWLAVTLLRLANLPASRLLGHLEIAPDRKSDPHPSVLDMAAFRGRVARYL